MIDYEHFAFCSPPRTATTWFIKACSVAGLGDGNKFLAHKPPPSGYNGFVLSMVRHPYDWLVSYYYSLKGGTIGVPVVDELCVLSRNCSGIHAFLRMYAEKHGGTLMRIYREYRPSMVFKVEDLPYGVPEFFESVGADKKDAQKVREMTTPENARKNPIHFVDKQLKKMIVKSEEEYCELYSYI